MGGGAYRRVWAVSRLGGEGGGDLYFGIFKVCVEWSERVGSKVEVGGGLDGNHITARSLENSLKVLALR